jgi:hypothetical protein
MDGHHMSEQVIPSSGYFATDQVRAGRCSVSRIAVLDPELHLSAVRPLI